MDRNTALERLKKYCASQDRSHQEVRTKLISLKIFGQTLEEIISELIQEDFLNEERFAKSYVRGKFKINKWGKKKIWMMLKAKNVSDYCIKKGMLEIEEDEYQATLLHLLAHKLNTLHPESRHLLFRKLINYGLQKGYEYDLLKIMVNELLETRDLT